MIKTVKNALPFVVGIILSAGAIGLSVQLSQSAVLIGGIGAALITSLLFYAVIRWDEAFVHEEMEKQRMACVADNAMDAIVICDSASQILYANNSARKAYGITAIPQDRETILKIGLHDMQCQEVFKQVLAGQPWNGELASINQQGQLQIHLVNIFKLDEFQGYSPALVSIGRDLSQRKELEKKLLHSQKLAAVGELAAGVAHEINNPMAAIQSQVGLAKDLLLADTHQTNSHQEILECIDEVSGQVEHCHQIVDSLLRFSSGQKPQISQIIIDQAVEEALRFVNALSRMKDMKVRYQPGSKIPPIYSDRHGVSQILINLLVNAADASQHQREVYIETHRPSENLIAIEVIDQGCGIEPENLDRVFEPFFTTKPPGQGTGLGLSISYGIARSLGGDLSLHCLPHGGTRASLTLPISWGSETSQSNPYRA